MEAPHPIRALLLPPNPDETFERLNTSVPEPSLAI
jgi:hypothetical protein